MKQARAFGVGVMIATQNPMDLDYRALGNASVWCVGRLQADADRARVIDGLGGDDGLRGPMTRVEIRRALELRRSGAGTAGVAGSETPGPRPRRRGRQWEADDGVGAAAYSR